MSLLDFETLSARRHAGLTVTRDEWAALAAELEHDAMDAADRGEYGRAAKLTDRAQVARALSGYDERRELEWEGRR